MVGIAGAGRARIDDQLAGRDFGQLDGPACQSQRMIDGSDRDQLFLRQHNPADRRILDPQSPETDVDTPVLKRCNLLHRRTFEQRDLNMCEAVAETPDHCGKQSVKRRSDETDAEAAMLDAADLPHHPLQLFHSRQNLHGMFVEQAPGFGQPDRTDIAVEQLRPHFLFKLADLPAQRRLGDIELLGRLREVAFIGDSNEVTELANVHLIPSRYFIEPRQSWALMAGNHRNSSLSRCKMGNPCL